MRFQVPAFANDSFPLIPVVISIASVFVVAGLAVLFFILFGRKRYAKQASILKEKYENLHGSLTVNCRAMVERLEVLGRFNNDYAIQHEERKKQYQEILSKKDKRIATSLQTLLSEIGSKNFHNAKPVLSQCVIDLDDFEKSVNTLNEELNSLLREDNATRDGSVSVRAKSRKVKEFYNANIDSLKPLEEPFNQIFHMAEETLAQYEKYNDQASFEEATEIIKPLDKILARLIEIMDVLPGYEALSHRAIPDKLNRLMSEYQQMLSEGYILNHLLVEKNVNAIQDELKAIDDQLSYLDINGIKEKFDAIQDRITELQARFQAEKQAKQDFEDNRAIISSSTYEIEKDYSRILKRLPEYQETFVLDQKYIGQIHNLSKDIENIGSLKRDLDSYLNTDIKRPYTAIYNKMRRLKQEIEKIKMVTHDYSEYLNSLKSTSQSVFDGLREYYRILKKAEFVLRIKIAVDSYTKAKMPKFEELYQTIADINSIVLTTPVDVTKASEAFAPFARECDVLVQEINAKQKACQDAEIAIVYANVYRKDYTDSRQPLDSAEKSFIEADFERAKSDAVHVVHTFKTTAENVNA